MIDRIIFYIKDVDFDSIEGRLGLEPAGIAKDESIRYTAKLKNLNLTYIGRRLQIAGSLHKFIKGNNYSLLTYEEAMRALIELSEYVGISLERFVVSQMELGLNISMDKTIGKYLELPHSYKGHPFIYMSPLKGTSQLKGCKCVLSEYTIKFYDKTFEVIKSCKVPKEERDIIPTNMLRYEIALSRKQLKNEGFMNVTGKNLLSKLHYIRFKKLMNKMFDNVILNDMSINYSFLSEDEIKSYIFAISDTYNCYLQYIKEHKGELEYRKEIRKKNALIKKVTPLKTGELEIELKSKFKIAISEI